MAQVGPGTGSQAGGEVSKCINLMDENFKILRQEFHMPCSFIHMYVTYRKSGNFRVKIFSCDNFSC